METLSVHYVRGTSPNTPSSQPSNIITFGLASRRAQLGITQDGNLCFRLETESGYSEWKKVDTNTEMGTSDLITVPANGKITQNITFKTPFEKIPYVVVCESRGNGNVIQVGVENAKTTKTGFQAVYGNRHSEATGSQLNYIASVY